MIRNIPNKYNQAKLMETLDESGQKYKYDFLYLPMDQKNNCNVGYAFINFLSPLFIVDFYKKFNGQSWKYYNSVKICDLKYGRIQGKKQLEKNFSTMQPGNVVSGKVRPYIADFLAPSKEEEEVLREQLFSQGFHREEAPQIEEPKRKSKIKIHQKLDKKVAFKKPHLPGTMSTGQGSAIKERSTDVVITGGDEADNDYGENDYQLPKTSRINEEHEQYDYFAAKTQRANHSHSSLGGQHHKNKRSEDFY